MTLLPFDRFVRRFLKPAAETVDGRPHLDVPALAREVQRYDADVRERLRLAALRGIEEELARIRAERQGR
jgi:hypothetical protein